MELYDEEIRYPKDGDKFFIEEGHPDEKASLNRHFQEFVTYADGYQTGALNLIEDALKNRTLMDIHIYPAVFLIRHFLELRLKELIQGLNYCNNQKKEFPQHHKIQNLWDDFKKAYEEFGGEIHDKRLRSWIIWLMKSPILIRTL